MQVELDFRSNLIDELYNELINHNFLATKDEYGTITVSGVSYVSYTSKSIELGQSGSMKYIVFLLDDLKYFKIHSA